MASEHVKTTAAALALGLATFAAASCADDPLGSGSGTATATIRFSLAERVMSSGLNICDEGSDVSLEISQDGLTRSPATKLPEARPDCGATFRVTIKEGKRADFTGLISGNGRPLLRGSAPLAAEDAKDGFQVVVPLDEVAALNVITNTIGFGGPDQYEFRVGPNGEPRPIGKQDRRTVGGIAASEDRRVTLNAGPCTVNTRFVDITTVESELADAIFTDIVCDGPGDVTVRIRSTGSCPTSYTLTLVQTDPAASPFRETRTVSPDGDQVFDNLPPGNYRATLDAGPGIVTQEQTFFLPMGGTIVINYDIDCGTPPPGTPGTIEIETRTTGPQAPTSYQFRIDGGSLSSIGANEKQPVTVAGGDHTVQLVGIPSNCTLASPAANPTSVSVAEGATTTVVFTIICTAAVTAPGSIRLSTTTVGPGAATANPYPFQIRDVDGTLVTSGTIALNGSTLLSPFNVQKNPHRVEFFPGSCVPFGPLGNPVQFVNVPSNGVAQAAFQAECSKGQSPP